MGWQEESENDETCAPLTEDEMREFQAISEQVTAYVQYYLELDLFSSHLIFPIFPL